MTLGALLPWPVASARITSGTDIGVRSGAVRWPVSEPVMPVRILTQPGPGQAMTSACTLRCHDVPGRVRQAGPRSIKCQSLGASSKKCAADSIRGSYPRLRCRRNQLCSVRGTSESRPISRSRPGYPCGWSRLPTELHTTFRISSGMGGRCIRRPDPGCDSHRRRRTASPDAGAA